MTGVRVDNPRICHGIRCTIRAPLLQQCKRSRRFVLACVSHTIYIVRTLSSCYCLWSLLPCRANTAGDVGEDYVCVVSSPTVNYTPIILCVERGIVLFLMLRGIFCCCFVKGNTPRTAISYLVYDVVFTYICIYIDLFSLTLL